MLILAIVLFAIAALLGFYLLTFVLQNKNTPKGVAFTHGPLAAMGLAALGGFSLIYRDLTGSPLPKWLAIGHGLTALIAFIFLIIFAFVK